MALAAYQAATLRLLNDPTNAVYSLPDVTAAINTGRGQIAGASHCIRYTATRATTAGVDTYTLSTFSLISGVVTPLNAQMGRVVGGELLDQREWEWFFKYYLAKPVRLTGVPQRWAIQEPGALAAVRLDPIPDQVYTLSFDVTGLPVNLVDDTTVEAIAYPWNDAIPYFAAYLLYQDKQRTSDAQAMLQRWGEFMTWGTRQVVSTVLPLYAPGGASAQTAAQKIVNTGIGSAPPARAGG
jgi:hypothetical protein